MPKTIFLLGLLAALCVGKALDCRAARSDPDYLVPVKKALGLRAAYEELWSQKLLVTPGEIARFVGLPGTKGVETTISVYRAPGKEGSLPGDYWVTATQASERLWNCVAPDAAEQVDPGTITIQRCDAPIGESTATAMHKTWLTMLSLSQPQRNSREIPVDSSREIFSAVDSDGRVLQGESSTSPKENTKALINIALSLFEYCGADVPGRATIAADVEKAASNLLGRIVATGNNLQNLEKVRHRKQSSRSVNSIPRRSLALFSNTREQRPDLPLGNPAPQHRDVINQLSPTEQKIVGTWSWTFIEGVGRIIFTADRKVKAGFPPDDKDGRRIGDDEFDIFQAGTWRLEGDVLITEMDNRPLINILEHLDPSNRPALETKVEPRKVVKIDGNKIVFDNGYSLDRVKRSARTLALVSSAAEPRLGSSIEDFRSAWGPPVRDEVLGRTATLVWRLADQRNEGFRTSIFEAEASFLDQIACGIVLRSRRRSTPDKMVRLAQPVLPNVRATDFAKPRSDVNGIRIYDLEDGTSVSVKQHEGYMILVIKGQCYLRNEDVFDREAAKVRPPTSNH